MCQPGVMPIAKSLDTTLCTEITSGVAIEASIKYATRQCRHCCALPRQPIAAMPNAMRRARDVA